jgi:hypothetical protein
VNVGAATRYSECKRESTIPQPARRVGFKHRAHQFKIIANQKSLCF